MLTRLQPVRRTVIGAIRPGCVQIREFAAPAESYTDKQEKTGRPISPYPFVNSAENAGMLSALPIVAISSLLVRVSGIMLTAGTIGIAGISLTGGDPAVTMEAIGQSGIGPLAKFAVAWPVSYHFLGGVRHYVSHSLFFVV
jgi:hypothetical protein